MMAKLRYGYMYGGGRWWAFMWPVSAVLMLAESTHPMAAQRCLTRTACAGHRKGTEQMPKVLIEAGQVWSLGGG